MTNDLLGLNDSKALQENFIRLLVAEVQHQDPTNPVDAKDFTQQFASLAMVGQSSITNEHLEKISNNTNGLNLENKLLHYSSYINKEVMTDFDKIKLTNGMSECEFCLENKTEEITLLILDKEMQELYRQRITNPQVGMNKIHWDGINAEGNKMPDGDYSITILDNNQRKLLLNTKGKVDSTKIIGDEIWLNLDTGVSIPASKVSSIHEPQHKLNSIFT